MHYPTTQKGQNRRENALLVLFVILAVFAVIAGKAVGHWSHSGIGGVLTFGIGVGAAIKLNAWLERSWIGFPPV